MLVIISLIVIAIVIIAVLMMFNMNAVKDEKNLENGSKEMEKEKSKEEVNSFLPTADSVDTQVQEKMEAIDSKHIRTSNMSDQAYRQVLQSFSKTDQEDRDMNPKEKMNDDIFRKALQSMSNKDENSNKS